eukprot:TRINITY_DN9141_c0_g2_i1.p1 TRINITY_DN9141_c0_g2~~TRINITY_DN9141_c0_g2_i1.p1  ORF type:complete len:493 (+),score=153.54 TRINITY_DN9141_c0_g2_i1:63-1541(+)
MRRAGRWVARRWCASAPGGGPPGGWSRDRPAAEQGGGWEGQPAAAEWGQHPGAHQSSPGWGPPGAWQQSQHTAAEGASGWGQPGAEGTGWSEGQHAAGGGPGWGAGQPSDASAWGGWAESQPGAAPAAGSEWGGMGVSHVHAPQSGFSSAAGDAYTKSDRRRMLKYQQTWAEDHPRVPTVSEDTQRAEEREANAAEREMKEVLERPGMLRPFFPDEAAMVGLEAHGEGLREVLEPPKPSSPASPKRRRRRRWLHEVKYARFERALAELTEMRRQRRVRKLRRVVAAGLATEHDYHKELRRLGLDAETYPLGFTPQAYRRSDASASLRSYVAGEGAAPADHPSGDPVHLAALEDVLGRSTELRDRWLDIQDAAGAVADLCRRTTRGDWKVLQDPLHFERIRNVLARSKVFFAEAGCHALPAHTVDVINSSQHGSLHKSLLGEDLAPTASDPYWTSADDDALSTRTYESFWAAADARCRKLRTAREPYERTGKA